MNDDRFKSLIAVLIALVTILGATVACLATVALSSAGDEDFAGMSAAITGQKEQIVNYINAYEHARAYAAYTRYLELGSLLKDEAKRIGGDKASELDLQRQEALGIASGLRSTFLLPRYEEKSKGYNIQRELDEEWADSSSQNDLDFQPHFNKADSLRSRSYFLFGDMIAFAVAFWFFTLAQAFENRWRYIMIGLGILIGLGGILGILIAEAFL